MCVVNSICICVLIKLLWAVYLNYFYAIDYKKGVFDRLAVTVSDVRKAEISTGIYKWITKLKHALELQSVVKVSSGLNTLTLYPFIKI